MIYFAVPRRRSNPNRRNTYISMVNPEKYVFGASKISMNWRMVPMMNKMRKMKNKKGFTLMEMLIVVAIIAILIAIAIPTFASSLNKARVATDEANIRWGALRKEGAPGRLLYLSLISSWKRCNHCGYAVFSLLRSARCCWKASSISSGINSWSMPTPL